APELVKRPQRYSARRIAKWARSAGVELPGAWPALCELEPAPTAPRKLEARSFEPADWQALRERLVSSEKLEDRLPELAQLRGLRAGDVLRLEREDLAAAVLTGEPLLVIAKGGRARHLLLGAGPLHEAASKLHDQLTGLGFEHGILAQALVGKSTQTHPYRA